MRARARTPAPPLPHPHHLPPSPLPLALPPHLLSRVFAPVRSPSPAPMLPRPSNHHRPAPTPPCPAPPSRGGLCGLPPCPPSRPQPAPLQLAEAAALPSMADAAALRSLPDLLRGAAVDPVTLPVELLARLSYPLRTSSTQDLATVTVGCCGDVPAAATREAHFAASSFTDLPAGAEDWMRPWLGRAAGAETWLATEVRSRGRREGREGRDGGKEGSRGGGVAGRGMRGEARSL